MLEDQDKIVTKFSIKDKVLICKKHHDEESKLKGSIMTHFSNMFEDCSHKDWELDSMIKDADNLRQELKKEREAIDQHRVQISKMYNDLQKDQEELKSFSDKLQYRNLVLGEKEKALIEQEIKLKAFEHDYIKRLAQKEQELVREFKAHEATLKKAEDNFRKKLKKLTSELIQEFELD